LCTKVKIWVCLLFSGTPFLSRHHKNPVNPGGTACNLFEESAFASPFWMFLGKSRKTAHERVISPLHKYYPKLLIVSILK